MIEEKLLRLLAQKLPVKKPNTLPEQILAGHPMNTPHTLHFLRSHPLSTRQRPLNTSNGRSRSKSNTCNCNRGETPRRSLHQSRRRLPTPLLTSHRTDCIRASKLNQLILCPIARKSIHTPNRTLGAVVTGGRSSCFPLHTAHGWGYERRPV